MHHPPYSEHFDAGPLAFAAAENEQLIGKLRVLAVSLLLVIPTVRVLGSGPTDPIYAWSFAFNSGVLLAALGIVWLQRRTSYRSWQGRISAVFDVTLVTALLLILTLVGGYEVGMLNRNTFPVYLIAVAASGLRLERGAVLLAGAAALLGWTAVVAVSVTTPGAQALAPERLHELLLDQTNRYMVLIVTTILALAIVRVGRRLVELASLDGLTGALNRGAFEGVLRRELQRSRRYGQRFALAYLDIDNLKATNDRHGHARGDAALRAIAQRLAAALRKSDVVARYGGDEFAVLLPLVTAADAVKRMDAIRVALAEEPLAVHGVTVPLRITIGIAGFPDDATEEITLLDVADSRLLAGKRAGRDRVVGP